MKKENVFEQKFKFLEDLARNLQDGNVSVDQLVPKMKEASEAIKVCKAVLKDTKSELIEIEKEFDDLISQES